MSKASPRIECNGDIDEAQAMLGLARAMTESSELNELLIDLERDLWILMADVATVPSAKKPKTPGSDEVTPEMVLKLEKLIDDFSERFEMPKEFVVPGETQVGAILDLARTIIRRAERMAVKASLSDSQVIPYLNRLSDLIWTLARWQDGNSLKTKSIKPK